MEVEFFPSTTESLNVSQTDTKLIPLSTNLLDIYNIIAMQ